ncbi:hypothetical protein DC366_08995 [Pelagivirga sediminicola]|uniref:Uncharacterized protein n=1 Tax=Pelagivirga sediminicola TaxID=2170575 RepID=A0A2T7G7H1_9RHOB|nr:hypothetical protein [Pelagivirga sediminicola]PVA10364.1 hypothetical protein DC366_08995 [Pelagivirga sediminicola]
MMICKADFEDLFPESFPKKAPAESVTAASMSKAADRVAGRSPMHPDIAMAMAPTVAATLMMMSAFDSVKPR